MNKSIIKVSCFFTGLKFSLIDRCSEESVMVVKRYASGLWAILLVWFFIGFNFVSRYFKANFLGSLAGAVFMLCIIISLERFIILGHKKSNWVFATRIFIGVVMAFIGSLILDQIVFKSDIEKQKQFLLGSEVDTIYHSRNIELRGLIDSLSESKNRDMAKLAHDDTVFNNHPFTMVKRPVTGMGIRRVQFYDTASRRVLTREIPSLIINYVDSPVTNPVHDEIVFLTGQLQKTDSGIHQFRDSLFSLKATIEKEVRQSNGFIDEQKSLWLAIHGSTIGMIAWFLFFFFFAAIELLIVLNKLAEKNHTSDYEALVQHQKEMHEKRIRLLAADPPAVQALP